MNRDLKKISTVNMSREEWLRHRKGSVGGSDAAAIIGLNDYSSAYSVWAEKLGKLPEQEENEAMRIGRDLEEYVAKRFTEKTGLKVRRENSIIYNPQYPFAHANVDRMIVGEDAILECKTCSALSTKRFKNGEYPANYYTQACHYMAVTGATKAYVAVLILGKEFLVFEIERDEDEIAALMRAEEQFWNCVTTNTPPAADGSKATAEALKNIYPEATANAVDLFGYEDVLTQYMALKTQIDELTKLKEEMANRVKAYMGESSRAEGNRYKVSWASQTRNTFDTKRFQQDHGHIDLSPYYKTTSSRIFKVTEL